LTSSLPNEDPARIDRTVAIRILPAAERAIREGHPWLFETSVTSESHAAPAGATAVVFDRKNRFLAAGLFDPNGPIRVRLLVHLEPDRIGSELFRKRLHSALERRRGILSADTTAMRILHGENDRMPGIVADLYADTVVLKIYSAAWIPHLESLVPLLREAVGAERILALASRGVREGPGGPAFPQGGRALAGPPPESGIPFLESGLHFEAHPLEGHKTGFYLDQRENRRRLERGMEGGRTLNVFSYSGAFSVYAARGGAEEVVDVDRAGPALDQARRHFLLNREDPGVGRCRHGTREGDAFTVLQELVRRGEVFQTVIVDPPSFASRASQRDRALAAYGRLTGLAVRLLDGGGLLVQASCSARVEADAFQRTVEAAARATGRPLVEVERTGHPPDHPVGFPEGAYLKCLWGRISG